MINYSRSSCLSNKFPFQHHWKCKVNSEKKVNAYLRCKEHTNHSQERSNHHVVFNQRFAASIGANTSWHQSKLLIK